jgi:hypothetical protein
MELRKMRAVVIGGSNTLMNAAYVAELPGAARALGIELQVAANLAVGNTGSLTGLLRLKEGTALRDADVLIVEYAVNDAVLYGEERAGLESWARAYEGIIRHALMVNPQLRIVSAILYNQAGTHRRTVPPIPAAIGYLSEWYGVTKVDAHRDFAQRFGTGYPDAPGLYMDAAHYSRPVFTRLIAELVARGVREALDRGPAPLPLPPPVNPNHYGEARVIACASAWEGLPQATYRNSVYNAEAVDLRGGDLELTVRRGRLLAALFACTADTARLRVRLGGRDFVLATLRPSIRDGKFRFLVTTANLEAIPPPVSAEVRYTLSVEPPAGTPIEVRQPGTVPHEGAAGTGFALISLMHTGEVAAHQVVQRPLPEERAEAA